MAPWQKLDDALTVAQKRNKVHLNLPTYDLPEGIDNKVALREEMIQNKKILIGLQKEMKDVIGKLEEMKQSNKMVFKSGMILIAGLIISPAVMYGLARLYR